MKIHVKAFIDTLCSVNGHSSEEANSSNESFRNGAVVSHIEEAHESLTSRYSDPPCSGEKRSCSPEACIHNDSRVCGVEL